LNIVNILPITSRKPDRIVYPNEVLLPANEYGLQKESLVLCHQIRTIDKRRLSIKYGQLSSKELQEEIIEAICFQLGIVRE